MDEGNDDAKKITGNSIGLDGWKNAVKQSGIDENMRVRKLSHYICIHVSNNLSK